MNNQCAERPESHFKDRLLSVREAGDCLRPWSEVAPSRNLTPLTYLPLKGATRGESRRDVE